MSLGSRILFLCLLCTLGAAASGKKKASEPYALVGGTVFREPGFALPGAQVTLSVAGEPGEPNIKKLTAISDSRGEFVFRVPISARRYLVQVTHKGYSAQQKELAVEGEQRVDATFTLSPESQ
jgi:hypothetical protein